MITLKEYIVKEILNNDAKNFVYKLIIIYLFGPARKKVVLIYRIGKKLYDLNWKFSSKLLFNKIEKNYGVFISPNAAIGIGLKLPHPTGIVIGDNVKIGSYATIFQGVTLGGARAGDAKMKKYPVIGDKCTLYAGAKILGNIIIGKSSIIGANSVVIENVPEYCTVAGIPAKIIKCNLKSE